MVYICTMTQTCKSPPATPRQAGRKKTELDRQLDARLFRALGDPTRLELLACLSKCARACSVSEIAECASVDLSVVSRHLAVLAAEDLLESRKEGRTVYYSVRHVDLARRLRSLATAFEDCCGTDLSCCAPTSQQPGTPARTSR